MGEELSGVDSLPAKLADYNWVRKAYGRHCRKKKPTITDPFDELPQSCYSNAKKANMKGQDER